LDRVGLCCVDRAGEDWLTNSWWDFYFFKELPKIRRTKKGMMGMLTTISFMIILKFSAQIWGMLTKKKDHDWGGGILKG
jgi:hypothetical protein